jgi:tagaturonate reductase
MILSKNYPLTLETEFPSNLPERILQFGTGVLLRGLCDYFVDKANKVGVFNGKIVVVKSTDTGSTDAFAEQDNLYTIAVRGIENGQIIKENYINSAISRTISAKNQWESVLELASSPSLEIIISNTTEVGIQYVEESIFQSPPSSFPAKLLAVLYKRFQDLPEKGFVIIPTELIVNNGSILKEIVIKLAHFNQLSDEFLSWLQTNNNFCNSLVDRIVPGKPNPQKLQKSWQELGYEDQLLIETEVYRLWAIQGSEELKNVLSFCKVDEGVVIKEDIEIYRELKLRLLNGTHTFLCGLGYLYGYKLVRETMNDEALLTFVEQLMLDELAPAIPYEIDDLVKQQFGNQVLDRFRNPFVDHQLLAITVQYSMKMRMRNIPLLLNYYDKFQMIPPLFACGFAGYLLFMKAVKCENGIYYGERKGEFYEIKCDSVNVFYETWQCGNIEEVVETILSNEKLWGRNLTELNGFADSVKSYLRAMIIAGVKEAIQKGEAIEN